MSARPRNQGFSLVELIVVMVIMGIIGAISLDFMRYPMEGYVRVTSRAGLVDRAESALRMVAQDIRRALPNSPRTVSPTGTPAAGNWIEMLHTRDGARYRDQPGHNPGGDRHDQPSDFLQFNPDDDRFNLLGDFNSLTAFNDGDRLAIYNLGISGADAFQDADPGADPDADPATGVITPAIDNGGGSYPVTLAADPDGPDERQIDISNRHQFSFNAPSQRLYVVDEAVMYHCIDSRLMRYSGYTLRYQPPVPGSFPNLPPGTTASALVADEVSCAETEFNYSAATNSRNGLASLRITLRDATGEVVTLQHQVHVQGSP